MMTPAFVSIAWAPAHPSQPAQRQLQAGTWPDSAILTDFPCGLRLRQQVRALSFSLVTSNHLRLMQQRLSRAPWVIQDAPRAQAL